MREEIIDYVNGKADIECKLVRAIGDPHERIDEDKLRMLRAVRFAATYNFELDSETLAAVQQHASELNVVSAERIGGELRRMLGHRSRAAAADLLRHSGLLKEVLLDGELVYKNRGNWRTRLRWLEQLGEHGKFEQAAFILISKLIKLQGLTPTIERWKLSNAESNAILWLENNLLALTRAHQLPWSEIQPLLIDQHATLALDVAGVQFGFHHEGVRFCRERLSWSREKLNPEPLLDGADLKQFGLKPGPLFKQILDRVRVLQLDGEISTTESALDVAQEIASQTSE